MNTDSTLLTILPLASESFCTFCHSGSLPNSCPILLGGVAAGVRDDVDQRVLGGRRILRHPIRDAGHAVLLENADRVIAEARQQVRQLAFVTGVGAQLEDAPVLLRARGSESR